ncbi:SDR family oxidoreductase [Streptomyces sp. NPDC050610]|uniref:SDR family oxidoreductase n=1 Tax=Streptomyces sp. NPDC050610 TaxID=3157097 RepID=UPI0034173F32
MSVVITGATGFLGSRVLRHLLAEETRETVTVLGRGSPDTLRERVEAAVAWLDGPPVEPDAWQRVRCVGADLTRPTLGLTPGELAEAAAGAAQVWHCAARLHLAGDQSELFSTNVRGTRAVLDLAEQAPDAHLVYVSTAFVAGRRDAGHIMEDDLSDADGFHTRYEETKYTTERMIRAWTAAKGRRATIVRPSLLVSDRPAPAGLPAQPLDYVARLVDDTLRPRADQDPGLPMRGGVLPMRLQGDPHGTMNLLQADYAAEALLRVAAAGRARTGAGAGAGVRTVHVTHPREVAFPTAREALRELYPGLRLTVVPTVRNPSRHEALVIEHAGHLLDFGVQRRTYDRTHLREDVGDLPEPPDVDAAYLSRAFDRSGARQRAAV